MKILVPIDGSSYSENSLSFVASRTSLLGHTPEIELLVVLDPLPARAARLVGKDSLTRYYRMSGRSRTNLRTGTQVPV